MLGTIPVRRALAAWLLTAVSAWGALAQEVVQDAIPTTFLESLLIDLIDVEVFVTDARGNPVPDLELEDFRLLEDGKRVKVEHFSWIDTTPPAGEQMVEAATPALASGEPARVLLYLDSFAINLADRSRLIEELIGLVDDDSSADVEYAVASYDGSFTMQQPFTRDRASIAAALTALEAPSSLGVLRQREREATAQESLELLRRIRTLTRSETRRTEVQRYFGDFSRQIEAHARRLSQLNGGSLYALSHVVNALGALPGRKALIYVGGGIPMQPGAELYHALTEAVRTVGPVDVDVLDGESRDAEIARRSAVLGAVGDSSPRRGRSARTASEELTLLTALANSSGVSFYPFKSEGNIGGVAPEIASDLAELYSSQFKSIREGNLVDTMRYLADTSGGTTAIGGDLAPLLERARADFSGHYSLAYTPSRSADGEIHQIKVKVKGRGRNVRYRSSYIAKPAAVRLADRASTAMLFGLDENPLGITLAIGRNRPTESDGHVIVPVIVGIPLGNLELTAQAGTHELDATLFIAAMEPGGQLAPVQEANLRIAVPAEQLETATTQVHTTQFELLMRTGPQRLAIGFVVPASGLTSYVSRDVDVRVR